MDSKNLSVSCKRTDIETNTIHLHLFCFISNVVKNQPVVIFGNFESVAWALLNFLTKILDPVD